MQKQYKKLCLNSDLSFLKEAMGEEKIDAFNYASNEYGVASALKDGMKDKLKGMATLGTVRFNTVQTPKYLVLSGDNLHLFDTDTDGEIDNHFCIQSGRVLKNSPSHRNSYGGTSTSTGTSQRKQRESIQTFIANRRETC